jgi:beta-lactamase class D
MKGITRMFLRNAAWSLAILGSGIPAASAGTICTIVANTKNGDILLQEGDCHSRVTPASTFKIAISLMGFDSGFLKDEHAPTLAYQAGDPDWGGALWLQPTDPARWIQYSVVWYSQRVTHALGAAKVTRYARAFDYGNADLSGDPQKNNGMDRAWISSSLKISPSEQITFLRRLVNRQLPVSAHAYDMTSLITQIPQQPDGWNIHGKTGAAYPRKTKGGFDEARGYGWFVGWATKGEQSLVFGRLIQDEEKHATSPGLRTRDALLEQWPRLANSLVK